MDSFVSIEPGMLIWLWVTFLALFLLMAKFAWKPILKGIESRENYVRDTLEKANRANEEAQALLEKNQELVAKAEAETQKMVKEGRELADKTRTEILAKAQKDADAVLEKARQEIEQQKQSALQELRSVVADLSVDIAGKLIGTEIDAGKHQKVIDAYLQELGRKN